MNLLKLFSTTAILMSAVHASNFSKLHDICDTTKTQKCPNISKEIALIQKFINIDSDKKLTVNGKWNSQTKEAIIAFQKKYNIPATGYIGEITKNQLNSVLTKKLALLKNKKTLTKKSHQTIKIANKKDTTKIAKSNNIASKVVKKKNIASKVVNKDTKKVAIANKKLNSIAKDSKAVKTKTEAKKIVKAIPKHFNSYEAFRKNINLRKSFAVYKDNKLLKQAKRAKTLLKVDVSEQRVKLFVNGKIALSAPCTTGAKRKFEPNTKTYRDKHTPYGTFKIMEKIATKRSTIFVDIYRHGKRIYHGDKRKYKGSFKGVKVVGAPLFNWMRLTSSGIGLHASSHVKRNPGSNGCIRLPKNVSNLLFSKVKRGTVVKVVN